MPATARTPICVSDSGSAPSRSSSLSSPAPAAAAAELPTPSALQGVKGMHGQAQEARDRLLHRHLRRRDEVLQCTCLGCASILFF